MRDTRTACAQTSQSIPKMVMSIERISESAGEAKTARSKKSEANFFMAFSPINLPERSLEEEKSFLRG